MGRLLQQNQVMMLNWRSFSEDFVVFDQLSGVTFKLDALRAFLLDLLSQGVRSDTSMVADACRYLQTSDHTSVPELVYKIIEEFVNAGLVEIIES